MSASLKLRGMTSEGNHFSRASFFMLMKSQFPAKVDVEA
jgi:hypothetical protein